MDRIARRKAEVRERILTAAFDLFVTEGPAATTLALVCERADVASRTFFNYFPTRQAMVVALAHRWLATFRDLDVVKTSVPMPTRIVSIFDDIAATLIASTDTYREMIGEMMAAIGHGTHRGAALHTTFVEMAEHGIASGEVTPRHDPITLADLIICALAGQIGNWTVGETSSLTTDLHDTACALADLLRADTGR